MIVTDSVYQLVNELCSSLQKTEHIESHQVPVNQTKLKTLKGRMREILLKTSPTNNSSDNVTHRLELYIHQLEWKMNGENARKCLAMEECCRLVERDEYFQTEVGQSVLAFLLKLRNTGNRNDQVCGKENLYSFTLSVNAIRFILVLGERAQFA